MPVSQADRDSVREFLAQTTRAVLVTRRRDGGFQTSPMSVLSDADGNVLISTRSTNAKVKNLQRDPHAAVCLITEKFLGPWVHLEGRAEIAHLPEALPALVDFLRRRGQTGTDAEIEERVRAEDRVLITLRAERVVLAPVMRAAPAGR